MACTMCYWLLVCVMMIDVMCCELLVLVVLGLMKCISAEVFRSVRFNVSLFWMDGMEWSFFLKRDVSSSVMSILSEWKGCPNHRMIFLNRGALRRHSWNKKEKRRKESWTKVRLSLRTAHSFSTFKFEVCSIHLNHDDRHTSSVASIPIACNATTAIHRINKIAQSQHT